MVYLIVFMFVFDFVFILFRIAWWPSAGKELSPWLSARVVFISCRLNCMCFFPVRCLGAGCGIRLYWFLIIAFSSTLRDFNIKGEVLSCS